MSRIILPIAFALTVSGCMTYAPIETPPQKVAFSSQTARTNVDSFSTSAVRTIREEGKKKVEVKGAACKIRGTGYSARVVTPALVELPTYRGKTNPVNISCAAGGMSATETVEPYNATLARIQSTQTSGGGLVGALAVAVAKGIAKSTRDPSKDEFAYRSEIALKLSESK
ncbi:hypothetical protein K3722_10875 [Leisingera caerulea]|uniref:Lipoprotein n=1 Tax=Leisingera caerulea TaxID=506591 RepID=A0ABY5WSC5_LEICA|nr:hypothetical protein [Leisingera caerulea]UWQ48409.1 hypothetical protein K3720_10680 [Leisingera caerulea]UWQ57040.1 hypothetical protein K3722_10875 [Leisingera caerulea]